MINILVLSYDNDGVGYYRINSPYLTIKDPEIYIDLKTSLDNTFNLLDEKLLSFYQIIVFHKAFPISDDTVVLKFMNIIDKYNIKLIFDIDDYWLLEHTHINYKKWIASDSKNKIENILKSVSYVTTTNEFLANEIKEFNKNVEIFENAVNVNEEQWIPNKKTNNKVSFIWGGGITHLPDLLLMKQSFEKFDKQILENSQVFMCGFDLRMSLGNKMIQDDPNRSTWTKFEDIFTNNNKWIKNLEYLKWLKEYDDIKRDLYGYNVKYKDEFYQRRWTKPILLYGNMYNDADVALAPLKNTKFNLMKSNLKIIEAGVHKMPIIASNFGNYSKDIINGKNGFLIDENDKYGWYEKIKFFINNKNAITDMGNELHNLVLEKYTLYKINKKRIDFLKNIVK